MKAKIIPVPENTNDEFVDKTTLEENIKAEEFNETQVDLKPNKKQKLEPKTLEGFTVLGVDNFAKKEKVRIYNMYICMMN